MLLRLAQQTAVRQDSHRGRQSEGRDGARRIARHSQDFIGRGHRQTRNPQVPAEFRPGDLRRAGGQDEDVVAFQAKDERADDLPRLWAAFLGCLLEGGDRAIVQVERVANPRFRPGCARRGSKEASVRLYAPEVRTVCYSFCAAWIGPRPRRRRNLSSLPRPIL